jgi:hypothetical protein
VDGKEWKKGKSKGVVQRLFIGVRDGERERAALSGKVLRFRPPVLLVRV